MTKIVGGQGVDRVKDDVLVVADAKAGQAVGFNRMQLFAAKATTSGTSVDFSPADGTDTFDAGSVSILVEGYE